VRERFKGGRCALKSTGQRHFIKKKKRLGRTKRAGESKTRPSEKVTIGKWGDARGTEKPI